MKDFVHIHSHTALGSLLDALQSVDDLFDLVNLKGQKALAITDHGTLTAHFDAYRASKRTGVKFIPGCEMYFVHSYDIIEPKKGEKGRKRTERRKHIVLLAQNEIGYKNLLKINYVGFQHLVMVMGRTFPRVSWEVLEEHNEGIIATSACCNGIIADMIFQNEYNDALNYAERISNIFEDRFYLEIQPNELKDDRIDQIRLNNELIKISKELELPLVAAVDSHYLTRDDEKVHDVLMAINAKRPVDDPTRHRYDIDEFYVKDGDEVFNFLEKHHGVEVAEEAVSNTVRIADRCDPPDYLEPSGNHLPVFDPSSEQDYKEFVNWRSKANIPANLPEDKAYMRFLIVKGFVEKFGHLSGSEGNERWQRVRDELKVLEGNNFSSYMLVTADFIRFARENDILVGVGRGCCLPDTKILTDNGFVEISNINVGDNVYTHKGELKPVQEKFKYDVPNEKLLTVYTDYSFGSVTFTYDHKVFGATNSDGNLVSINDMRYKEPSWKPLFSLENGDFIFMPFPSSILSELGLKKLLNKYNKCINNGVETIKVNDVNSAHNVRETLLELHIPNQVMENDGCYSIIFTGIDTSMNDSTKDRIFDNGYYTKIENMEVTSGEYVYDIQVKDDHSYVTQNFAVHNSVGGSLVAHLLGIHGVDPFDYGLLFERFQNAYKTDLPDIDTDFTSAGRDLVQEYVRNKYGYANCAQVSNINTYTPKNVIPDLVKSMRNIMPELIPQGANYVTVAESIKKAIPDEDKDGKQVKTLEKALELSPKLREFANACPELMEYADKIVGMPKEFSTHAAGTIVSDIPIYEFSPLRIDKNSKVATQYEKNRCEVEGLIKMDFLAISTLDVIDESIKNIRKLGIRDAPKCVEDIPLNDQETYKMIQRGQTRCVFQLGKSGIMAILCKQIKPRNILDIAMINALGRPSAKDIRQEYVDRRNGTKPISYPHESLRSSLDNTYGLAVTEEQLMGFAQDVAGWDLNKADGLRKYTKLKGKKPELALKLETEFIEGMMETHDVSYELAKKVWDDYVLAFSGYGFNLSHAVFYSINGYITAYLKRHYPAAFLAAYLKVKTSKGGINRDEEIASAKAECRAFGVKIMPPDINMSKAGYEVFDEKSIIMGLGAIKGLGGKALGEIVSKQPFDSFAEFLHTVSSRIVNKSKIGALAKAGCFDSFNITRKDVFDEGKNTRDKMNNFLKKKLKDGYDVDMVVADFPLNLLGNKWTTAERLQYEHEVLGELISGTVNDLFPGFFTKSSTPFSKLKTLPAGHKILVEAVVKELTRESRIKSSGRMMSKYILEDVEGYETELTVWPNDHFQVKKLVCIGKPIRAICEVNEYGGNKSLVLRELQKVYGK